ncbi:MAG: peptidoglycan DD-metalloendopeptidase family protein [Roseivirga sp.]
MKSNKAYWIGIVGALLLAWQVSAAPSSKKQFEAERAVLLQRIKNIQQVLKQTKTRKETSLGQLKALNKQIESNALLIQSISREVQAINQDIRQKQRAIVALKQDLAQLKKEYAAMVYVGAKALNDIHQLMFIFSASSFYELIQRLRYVKQYTQIRHKHFLKIEKGVTNLQKQQTAAAQRKQAKSVLLHTRQTEKGKLIGLRTQQTQQLGQLEQQRSQLEKELQERNKAVKRLDKLIRDIVQQAAAPAPPTPTSPAPKAPAKPVNTQKLTAPFRKSRGKLPWPVKTGFISGKFGIGPHPVLRNIQVENLGIDIQTQAGAQAHAVFEGVVKTIAFVPGMNQVVIIQHGTYHSVYARLKEVTVEVGQYVAAQTSLGTIYTDAQGTTELQLQLWEGTKKLNPAWWLKKEGSK